jgi:hypothetical protein
MLLLNITINQTITAVDAINNLNDRAHNIAPALDLLSAPLSAPS